MNLNSLDLNLLVALDALLRDASVSRAAMRIGLSQPAASHALQRLRDLIGDPLLVRNGARMELTPRAQALRAPLAQALEQVRSLFMPEDFDAPRSERHFRLMMADLVVELLMPPLMAKISRIAPNVTIDVVPWRGPAIFTAEFARTIDLVISIGNAFGGFHRQLLYTDSDALAVRHEHPAGAKLKNREVFLAARHVAVVKRGQNADLIRYLAPRQRHRTTDRAGGARLYRGAPRHRAYRPRRIRTAAPDHVTVEAVIAANGDATTRSGDRRTVPVLPDPCPDGSRLDLVRNLVLETGRGLDGSKRRAA
jgi:DNA-binding transcriptional LysR family regulator